jgi:hypothetical protein
MTALRRVDFPEPLAPTTQTVSLAFTLNETPWRIGNPE